MKRFIALLSVLALGMLLVPQAVATDIGSPDMLRLSDAVHDNGEWKVAVHAINDEELVALDIPIRFGQAGDPIELLRVEFTDRVAEWDFTHAAIDNQAKTVILGLISELVNMRGSADMKVSATGNTKIADLVFRVADDYDVSFTTFTTESPGHELTFLYNRYEAGIPYVETFVPAFEANVTLQKATLPTEYALSQNYPNPFNPSTSFTLSLPEASDYSVQIFNIVGQAVRTYQGHLEAGEYEFVWNGISDQGSPVASGVYFLNAEASRFSQVRKMTLLK